MIHFITLLPKTKARVSFATVYGNIVQRSMMQESLKRFDKTKSIKEKIKLDPLPSKIEMSDNSYKK